MKKAQYGFLLRAVPAAGFAAGSSSLLTGFTICLMIALAFHARLRPHFASKRHKDSSLKFWMVPEPGMKSDGLPEFDEHRFRHLLPGNHSARLSEFPDLPLFVRLKKPDRSQPTIKSLLVSPDGMDRVSPLVGEDMPEN